MRHFFLSRVLPGYKKPVCGDIDPLPDCPYCMWLGPLCWAVCIGQICLGGGGMD